MIYLLIFYIFGVIIAQRLFRRMMRNTKGDKYCYDDVVNGLFVSALSWIVVLVFCSVLYGNKKPPRWL